MADSMLYVKLDVNYADDPKIIAAGEKAEILFVRALCLAKRILSDGFIASAHLPRFGLSGASSRARKLVEAGLWVRDDDRDGWWIASWSRRNPSAAEVDAKRSQASEDGLRGNHRRWHADRPSPGCPHCPPDTPPDGQPESGTRSGVGSPETETETETETEPLNPLSPDAAKDDGFEHFWAVWPRRHGKKLARDKAHRAWARLTLPQRRDAYRGAVNYARASDAGLAGGKDAFRWLQGREWPDWQTPAAGSRNGDRAGSELDRHNADLWTEAEGVFGR